VLLVKVLLETVRVELPPTDALSMKLRVESTTFDPVIVTLSRVKSVSHTTIADAFPAFVIVTPDNEAAPEPCE